MNFYDFKSPKPKIPVFMVTLEWEGFEGFRVKKCRMGYRAGQCFFFSLRSEDSSLGKFENLGCHKVILLMNFGNFWGAWRSTRNNRIILLSFFIICAL